ncbi:MAG: hypothetical protein PHN56_01875 [Candidatus Nanoarchaeia archaeon]|nr:hypothetical protein [Candidatus Nanoarchaeia archaeon]
MTIVEEIITALEKLGGIACYSELYDQIQKDTKRTLPINWEAGIRNTIENHSSDSENFKGKNLFYSVNGIGNGIWGLRSLKSSSLIYNKKNYEVNKINSSKNIKLDKEIEYYKEQLRIIEEQEKARKHIK